MKTWGEIIIVFSCIVLVGCSAFKGKDGRDGSDGTDGIDGGQIIEYVGTLPNNATIKIHEIAGKTCFVNVYVYIKTSFQIIPTTASVYYGAYYYLSFTTGEFTFANCPQNAQYKIVVFFSAAG